MNVKIKFNFVSEFHRSVPTARKPDVVNVVEDFNLVVEKKLASTSTFATCGNLGQATTVSASKSCQE
jgi:hypothetical protein